MDVMAKDTRLTGLNALARALHETEVEHGFYDDWALIERDGIVQSATPRKYLFPVKIALAMTELGEAIDADREGNDKGVAEEVADVIIRLLGLSVEMGIDLDEEIARKAAYNKTREYRHGKRY